MLFWVNHHINSKARRPRDEISLVISSFHYFVYDTMSLLHCVGVSHSVSTGCTKCAVIALHSNPLDLQIVEPFLNDVRLSKKQPRLSVPSAFSALYLSMCQPAWKMGFPNHVRDMNTLWTTNLSAGSEFRAKTRIKPGGVLPSQVHG